MTEYIAAFVVGAILTVIFGVFLIRPVKMLLKLALKCAGGFFMILFFNMFSVYTGISIGVNFATAVTAGILGLPGLSMMLILNLTL